MTTIIDNLNKRPEPTTPKDTLDPPRFSQSTETTKDAFILEIEKFFNREDIPKNRLIEIPTIRKFDISFKSNERSHETAVKIIRKFPELNENLPLIAVLATTGRNLPMGIGGQYVHAVAPNTSITGITKERFVLTNGQTLRFTTITSQKEERYTTIIFRASRFCNVRNATAQEVADEINFQALYARATVNSCGSIVLSYGGPADKNNTGDIVIGFDGDAGSAARTLGFTLGQKSEFNSTTPFNRYIQATSLDVAMEIVSEDDNIRTELTDLLWSFFTFYMDERDYMFLGRSIFDPSIPNETYQVIIKPDPVIAGESEVPRPGDEMDKLYVNRINVSVTTMWYTDRAVLTSNNSPLYYDATSVVQDGTIPQKN